MCVAPMRKWSGSPVLLLSGCQRSTSVHACACATVQHRWRWVMLAVAAKLHAGMNHTGMPCSTSQRITRPSSDPETSLRPSRDHSTPVTASLQAWVANGELRHSLARAPGWKGAIIGTSLQSRANAISLTCAPRVRWPLRASGSHTTLSCHPDSQLHCSANRPSCAVTQHSNVCLHLSSCKFAD